jgi:hypothetical protein
MSNSDAARLRRKPFLVFAAQSIALAVLIGSWPTPRDVYPTLFHAHANALLSWWDSPAVELATPSVASGLDTDTVVIGAPRRGAEPAWQSWFSVRRIGYWPSAALVALLLATPLSAGRRALAIAAGLVLIDLFTLARIAVEVAYLTYELDHGPGAPVQGPLHLLLRVGSESLSATIPSAAFVLVSWVAVGSPWRSIELPALRTRSAGSPPV